MNKISSNTFATLETIKRIEDNLGEDYDVEAAMENVYDNAADDDIQLGAEY